MNTSNLVSAQEIKSRIRSLMDDSSNIRMKRTKMKEKCMKALTEGGSSDCSIQRLIGDMIANISWSASYSDVLSKKGSKSLKMFVSIAFNNVMVECHRKVD